jgi:hypothetical protein
LPKDLPNRKILIKYLLGELPAEERASIAERYFLNDDWFEELLDVENELLDKYVGGSLSEKEREAFKQYLERLPEGQQKEAVAKALAQFTDDEKARSQQILNEYVPSSVSRWRVLLRSISKPQAGLQYIVAVNLLVMVAGLWFLFSQFRQLRNDNEQLRAQIVDLEKEKESFMQNAQTDANSERLRLLEEQLKLEQQANEAQAQRLAVLQPTTPVVISWMLTSAMRSAGSLDKVTLPQRAKFVSIMMPIDSEEKISSYRVIIQTTSGETRHELLGMRPNQSGKSVALKLPASYFQEKSYKVTLVGRDKTGDEIALDYYFTVARK